MFEWHGWATIVGTPSNSDLDGATERAIFDAVAALVSTAAGPANETVDLRWANGTLHLWLAGAHNRPTDAAVELYRRVAEIAPGSYGVLHALHHDAIDMTWRRWVMRRGVLLEETEPSLSPHIPIVEDASEPGSQA